MKLTVIGLMLLTLTRCGEIDRYKEQVNIRVNAIRNTCVFRDNGDVNLCKVTTVMGELCYYSRYDKAVIIDCKHYDKLKEMYKTYSSN